MHISILYLGPTVKLILNKIPKARAYHPKQEFGILVSTRQSGGHKGPQLFGGFIPNDPRGSFTFGSVPDPREQPIHLVVAISCIGNCFVSLAHRSPQ